MAINKIKELDGNIKIYQEAFLPTVYLDTWAYNTFVSSPEKGERFINILNKKNGTLLISDLNLFELCKAGDLVRFTKIVELIEQLDQAFIETNPNKVIKREKVARFDVEHNFITPSCNKELLKALVLDTNINQEKPYNLADVFRIIRNCTDKLEEIKNNYKYEQVMMPRIKKCRNDTNCHKRALKRNKDKNKLNKELFPHTEDINRQFIDFLVVNKNMKMPNKEWCDAFHTIVPSAYSDSVLLDKRWNEFIKNTGLIPPSIANVYNPRELEKFFTELESFDKSEKEEIFKKHITGWKP